MGCLFVLLILIAPRLALLLTWLFTPLVSRAFGSFIVPLLGFIFLPLTTLAYALVYVPHVGVTGFGWFWVILGLLIDLATYGGSSSTYSRQ
jgi:hypothetical protein